MRASRLAKELDWFIGQGYIIPEAGPAGISYANYLRGLSQTNMPAFVNHLHNVYYAETAGEQFLVQKVSAVKLFLYRILPTHIADYLMLITAFTISNYELIGFLLNTSRLLEQSGALFNVIMIFYHMPRLYSSYLISRDDRALQGLLRV